MFVLASGGARSGAPTHIHKQESGRLCIPLACGTVIQYKSFRTDGYILLYLKAYAKAITASLTNCSCPSKAVLSLCSRSVMSHTFL